MTVLYICFVVRSNLIVQVKQIKIIRSGVGIHKVIGAPNVVVCQDITPCSSTGGQFQRNLLALSVGQVFRRRPCPGTQLPDCRVS